MAASKFGGVAAMSLLRDCFRGSVTAWRQGGEGRGGGVGWCMVVGGGMCGDRVKGRGVK